MNGTDCRASDCETGTRQNHCLRRKRVVNDPGPSAGDVRNNEGVLELRKVIQIDVSDAKRRRRLTPTCVGG